MAPGFGGLACRGALRGRPPPPMGCLLCIADAKFCKLDNKRVIICVG